MNNKSPKEKEKKVKSKSLKKSKSNEPEKPKEKSAKGKKDKQPKQKKEKPEGQPKKPQTAYFLFCADKRAENKDKKYTAKELGDLFKALPEEKKEEKIINTDDNKNEDEIDDVNINIKNSSNKKKQDIVIESSHESLEKENNTNEINIINNNKDLEKESEEGKLDNIEDNNDNKKSVEIDISENCYIYKKYPLNHFNNYFYFDANEFLKGIGLSVDNSSRSGKGSSIFGILI